jgi:hypothetical protein
LQGGSESKAKEMSTRIDLSSDVIDVLSKAEAERMLPGGSKADLKAKEKDIAERMVSQLHT